MIKKVVKNLYGFLILFLLCFLSGCSSLNEVKTSALGIPFITETGETIKFPLTKGSFMGQESEHFRITNFGIDFTGKDTWCWTYGFAIKDKNIEIEYVKIQNIMPYMGYEIIYDNKSMRTPMDKYGFTPYVTLKNGSSGRMIQNTLVINGKTNENYGWYGKSYTNKRDEDFNNTFLKEKYIYLAKFTIKAKGYEPEIIYQPARLPVYVFSSQRKL